jgi:hypothetical protein
LFEGGEIGDLSGLVYDAVSECGDPPDLAHQVAGEPRLDAGHLLVQAAPSRAAAILEEHLELLSAFHGYLYVSHDSILAPFGVAPQGSDGPRDVRPRRPQVALLARYHAAGHNPGQSTGSQRFAPAEQSCQGLLVRGTRAAAKRVARKKIYKGAALLERGRFAHFTRRSLGRGGGSGEGTSPSA